MIIGFRLRGQGLAPEGFVAFVEGKIERKETFASRKLDPTPKFVRERLSKKSPLLGKETRKKHRIRPLLKPETEKNKR